ncbi:hypothetical protein Tco_1199520 [Tanacetum coccineum]
MTKLAFCDYHNMVAILEKTERNTDFHQIVDFLEASTLRYALLLRSTVYVSHIRQFWSTARIETADGETHIVAKIDGKQRTVSESLIRKKLRLKDEEGISTLPDNELFENLSRMGYNISTNQRFSFNKGQFSHQWKFLIHTIMQCISPKSTAFNEFSSNIATAIVCLATNRTYNFSKMIFDGMIRNVNNKGTKKFLMYPRFLEKLLQMSKFGAIKHTKTYPVPFQTQKVFTTLRVNSPSFSGRTVPLFDTMIIPQGEGSENQPELHHTPSSQHSKALSPVADETALLTKGDRHGEAFPTASSLDAGQDRENIPKTSALPHESSLRVTSLGGDEGSLQQKLNELMEFCTKLQSQHTQMAAKIQSQDLEISHLKARIKTLEDAQMTRGSVLEDASNMGGMMDQGEDLSAFDTERDSNKNTDKGSESTGEMANVLSSMRVANILASGGLNEVVTTTSPLVPPVSSFVPTVVANASATPRVSRPSRGVVIRSTSPISINIPSVGKEDKRKGKEIMTEPEKSDRAKAQELMKIARIQAEEDLKQIIDGLDRSNKMINKHMEEYEKAENDMSIEEKIEIITELIKYQKDRAQIKKYQAQQKKLASKTEGRKFYTSVLRSHAGWKTKDFKGMTFKQIEETFILVWKSMQDFVPMDSKKENERLKRT